MSQPLTFSDDETTLIMCKQLQEHDISHLMAGMPSVNDTVAVDKENAAWRVNGLVKDASPSLNNSFSFHPSPVKTPAGKELLQDSPVAGGNVINGINAELSAKKEEEDVKEEKWDVKFSKTPGSAAASKRKRILRKIKTEMAEEAELKTDRNTDPDFVYIGDDDEDITPTPFRLRSSQRTSRISYRNLDWSTEENDRKRNRLSALMIDLSEEEREMEAAEEAQREAEEEQRRRRKMRKRRKRQRGASVASSVSSTVRGSAFSVSDDDSLATIAKRARVEEEEEEEQSASTVLEIAFSISDDDSLAKIARKNKKKTMKEEEVEEEERSASTVLETAFSISDDDSLATVAKRAKKIQIEQPTKKTIGIKQEPREEQEEGGGARSTTTAIEDTKPLVNKRRMIETVDLEPTTAIKKTIEVKQEPREEQEEGGGAKSAPTALETAFSISDDESLSAIVVRLKKKTTEIKQEPREEEGGAKSAPTVLQTALETADESLSAIEKRIKEEQNEIKEELLEEEARNADRLIIDVLP